MMLGEELKKDKIIATINVSKSVSGGETNWYLIRISFLKHDKLQTTWQKDLYLLREII